MSKNLKITKVETQKRPGRYNIYLNDNYAFPVSEEVLIKFSLFKGTVLTKNEIEQIKAAESNAKLYGKAVDFISYQLRTKQEVRDKLKSLTEDEAAIEATLEKLEKIKLIDDQNYANSYVRQVADGQAKGPLAAKRYLTQKGVSESLISQAIELHYPASRVQENALQLAQKLFDQQIRYPYNKRIEKTKLSMVRKGFSFAIIDEVLDQIDDQVDQDAQTELIQKVGRKLWKKYRAAEPYQRKQKLKQALYRRGFDLDAIDEFMTEIEGD